MHANGGFSNNVKDKVFRPLRHGVIDFSIFDLVENLCCGEHFRISLVDDPLSHDVDVVSTRNFNSRILFPIFFNTSLVTETHNVDFRIFHVDFADLCDSVKPVNRVAIEPLGNSVNDCEELAGLGVHVRISLFITGICTRLLIMSTN